jgi:hypothetical protein
MECHPEDETAFGHKTLEVFKRYNSVSKDELKALVGENR